MKSKDIFNTLQGYDRARVALAVLLDGSDAPLYLMNDSMRGGELRAAAEGLLKFELDVRFPYLATMLRLALEEVS